MYVYNEYDQNIIDERVAQFRDQTERYLKGQLSETEFLPLRLQNGLYVQRYAPMLRVAIPYGTLSSTQMRTLAYIARHYDKGYGHFSTRCNIQYNWPKLESVPDILADLAKVQMHAIQTSGNCIRNTTTDQYAGVDANELLDPRPYCEVIRQWSTFHPEFAFLPRKFKIAVTANHNIDRAATQVHDIGLHIVQQDGEVGFKVLVGGGLGRTPVIASTICEFLPEAHLLTYLEAILRVYNQYGRRDNKYKARIKILVKAMGIEAFKELVEKEWNSSLKDSDSTLDANNIAHFKSFFVNPEYDNDTDEANKALTEKESSDANFKRWLNSNTLHHKHPAYRIVTLALKHTGTPPGDVTDTQMDKLAEFADQYSFSELRISHNQNVILPHVKKSDLYDLWLAANTHGMGAANLGHLTDMICCPGGDFCALANAKSIPVAEEIQNRFENLDYLYDIGELELNISGCMNACGHHHVGNIGILGVDKKGQEFYQISVGGSSSHDSSIGKILGPSFSRGEIVDAVETLIQVYLEQRLDGERFIDTYRRVEIKTFKERVYAKNN